MISEEKQRWALDLLAVRREDGLRRWSHRRVAEMVGCSRGTVGKIARRGHAIVPTKKPAPTASTLVTRKTDYCETCGAKVSWPCRECWMKKQLKKYGPYNPEWPEYPDGG